uniref:Uncharacterized protein MANES_11G059900 n=1 Tax=Rhizophora mucronata TaxID=61149 RepID=A0A2P2MMD7_RHIMU
MNKFQNNILQALGEITSMRTLNLSFNNFGGSFPVKASFEKISSLKKLEVLDLSHNAFQTNIPQYLGEITSLSTLNLSFNGFEGPFPIKGT